MPMKLLFLLNFSSFLKLVPWCCRLLHLSYFPHFPSMNYTIKLYCMTLSPLLECCFSDDASVTSEGLSTVEFLSSVPVWSPKQRQVGPTWGHHYSWGPASYWLTTDLPTLNEQISLSVLLSSRAYIYFLVSLSLLILSRNLFLEK